MVAVGLPVLHAGFGYSQLFQDDFKRAKLGEPALKQIGPDECREPKPIGTEVNRAGFHAQAQGNQDEKAGNDANDAMGGHGVDTSERFEWAIYGCSARSAVQ
jgi:hypothetical protein